MIAGVPYDAQIAYLQSDGNAYIDMGRPIGSGFWFEATLKIIGTNNQYKSILGARTGSGVEDYQFSFVTYGSQAQNRLLARYGTNSSQFFAEYPATEFLSVRVDADYKLYFNGTLAATLGDASPSSQNLFLFALNDNGTASQNLSNLVRVYDIKYGDSNGQHDLIPVRVGQVGYLYDRVTRKLYGNAGTGSFTLGPDVATPVMGLRTFGPSRFGKFGKKLVKAWTARDYVQTGLVAMYDLIENAGWGVCDESATRWMNLATGLLASDSGFVFTSDGAYVTATKNFSVPRFTLFNHTIEARLSRFPDTQQNHGVQVIQYMSLNGGSSVARGFTTQRYPVLSRQYIYEISGFCLAPADIVPEDKHTLAATFEYDGTSTSIIRYYIDGELAQSSTLDAVLTQANQYIYAQLRQYNYLDRLNIYSRALTADEIAHNYRVDKLRFGLP